MSEQNIQQNSTNSILTESELDKENLAQPSVSSDEDLKKKISELETELEKYKDLLLRKAAEFDNYKKRSEGEYLERIQFANEELILSILPILDDFERSFKMGKEGVDFQIFYRGIELIYQKLIKVLEQRGVKHFESVGKVFDPYFHDALLQIPRSDLPPHTIIEEVEKGYLLNNKVIRHAKVIVSSDNMQSDENSNRTEVSEKPNDNSQAELK